jgi:hypothetical protein
MSEQVCKECACETFAGDGVCSDCRGEQIRALAAELERQREHNKLQQASLHELHARLKDKDAAIA